jgi:hypothetical protein
MMRYGIIRPKEMTLEVIDEDTIHAAVRVAGLSSGEVDHGSLDDGRFGIVVYEFVLFDLLYQCNDRGETVDFEPGLMQCHPRWFSSALEVELSIEAGRIIRPTMSINNHIFWRWPQPAPKGFGR